MRAMSSGNKLFLRFVSESKIFISLILRKKNKNPKKSVEILVLSENPNLIWRKKQENSRQRRNYLSFLNVFFKRSCFFFV